MFSAATAAVKQAESFAKEIRGNEEAIKWAEQVKGYGAGWTSLSTDLRSRALPTFTSIISHIAPPISAHERLQIHITHDIQNYPSLDPLIYETFARVMAQVEGGDLLVIQRGSEQRARSRANTGAADPLAAGYRGGILRSGHRWTDGPWWRDGLARRDLNAILGLAAGSRLARVNAESYAREFFDAHGGVEAAAQHATETLSESNPVRTSDIFLAIQAVRHTEDRTLFAASSSGPDPSADPEPSIATTVVDPDDGPEDVLSFAIYLHDPLHSLSIATLSQPFPQQWSTWLDATPGADAAAGDRHDGVSALPASIMEIVHAGGVDPREWVAEWMEEVLGLAVGVIAQRYVARRMGVGSGDGAGAGVAGRGKMRAAEEEGVAGEAARAL